MKLKVPFEGFENNINAHIIKGEEIIKQTSGREFLYNDFKPLYKEWLDSATEIAEQSFEKERGWLWMNIRGCYNLNAFDGTPDLKLKEIATQKIKELISSMRWLLELLSVCDFYTGKTIEIKELKIKEKYDFVLQKLYELRGDNLYFIDSILEGNAIKLDSLYESREIAKKLMEQDLIECIFRPNPAGRLTMFGIETVEEGYMNDDAPAFISVSNNFINSTIHQLNQGGNNTQTINYISVLDQMKTDGVPSEIIKESEEILKNASKSESLKNVATKWIKNLPFTFIEKAGAWVMKNSSKVQQYQHDLSIWIDSLL